MQDGADLTPHRDCTEIKQEPFVYTEDIQDVSKQDEGFDEYERQSPPGLSRFSESVYRAREESAPRLRICFDPEHEIPLLQKWFSLNHHPTRTQVRGYYSSNTIILLELQESLV